MKETTITITQYAALEGITRDGVYKRIANNKLPANVKLIKVAGRNFIKLK